MIAFCYNPSSWDRERDAPWPGGMVDCLVRPILPHLSAPWRLSGLPQPGSVNVYYSHRRLYRARREPGRVSVFVSHGIADKNWRSAAKVGDQFDYVCVSGPAWSERMVAGGLSRSRILEVGYAKLDPLFDAPRVPGDGRIRVLIAPTHGGGGESSLTGRSRRTAWWSVGDLVDLFDVDRFDVTVAPHPRHHPQHRATLREFLAADVVIADGGSTIYEAWALDLPVVFPSWLTAAANMDRRPSCWTFEQELYRRRLGRHAQSPGELVEAVVDAAAEGITCGEQEFVEPILPRAYRGVSGRLHAEAFDALASGETPRHTALHWVDPIQFRGPRGQMVTVERGSSQADRLLRSPRWSLAVEVMADA